MTAPGPQCGNHQLLRRMAKQYIAGAEPDVAGRHVSGTNTGGSFGEPTKACRRMPAGPVPRPV